MMIQNHSHGYHQLNQQRVGRGEPAGRSRDGAGAEHQQQNDGDVGYDVQTEPADSSRELLPFGKHAFSMGGMQNSGRSAYTGGNPARMGSAFQAAHQRCQHSAEAGMNESQAPSQSTEPVVENVDEQTPGSAPLSEDNGVDQVPAQEGVTQTPALPQTTEPVVENAEVFEARATTARRDASLKALAAGPVSVNGTEITQLDGFKAISDASWDRYNTAYANLPAEAQAAIKDQFTVVVSDFSQQPGASEQFAALDPALQQEAIWSWQAEAAQNYGESSGALGNPADLVDLADGARQYNEARLGYLAAGGTPGQ